MNIIYRCVAFLLLWAKAAHSQGIVSVHGSGTTNPSKCYWLIMSQIMDRAKMATRLTYRAVGSSTGQFEFAGVNNTGDYKYVPYNDFGSGDIPIPTETFETLADQNISIVHLPIVLGGISFFHSVPNIPDGKEGLNLTSCTLAKIMKREIKFWDDEEIVALNPNLASNLPVNNYPINVARRVRGSSSTSSITQYLHKSCKDEWPENMVGSTIDWPEDTLKCEGSGGMTSCIVDNEGTIGYIDAGHGHSENLIEIELENADGHFLSSKEADENGGIGSATVAIPSSADLDFGGVSLLNQPGRFTWPIVAMSYIYVRKDLITFDSADKKALFIAFLESLYDDDTINQCKERYRFTPVPAAAKALGLAGIAMLDVNPADSKFTFEVSTEKGLGQGDYVVSAKRRGFAELSVTSNTGAVEDLLETIESMDMTIKELSGAKKFTSDKERQITIALALSFISIALWFGAMAVFIIKSCA